MSAGWGHPHLRGGKSPHHLRHDEQQLARALHRGSKCVGRGPIAWWSGGPPPDATAGFRVKGQSPLRAPPGSPFHRRAPPQPQATTSPSGPATQWALSLAIARPVAPASRLGSCGTADSSAGGRRPAREGRTGGLPAGGAAATAPASDAKRWPAVGCCGLVRSVYASLGLATWAIVLVAPWGNPAESGLPARTRGGPAGGGAVPGRHPGIATDRRGSARTTFPRGRADLITTLRPSVKPRSRRACTGCSTGTSRRKGKRTVIPTFCRLCSPSWRSKRPGDGADGWEPSQSPAAQRNFVHEQPLLNALGEGERPREPSASAGSDGASPSQGHLPGFSGSRKVI